MRKIKRKLLLFSIIGLLCGCSSKELTKTIVLPEQKPDQLDSAIINIQNMKEYSYEGNISGMGNIALDAEKNVCLIREIEKQYVYQKINLDTKEIISTLPIEEDSISQFVLSPNGQYVAYEKVVQMNIQLKLFSVEKGTIDLLDEWEGAGRLELLTYQWSSDGMTLFAWPDYVSNPYEDWWIYRYQLENTTEFESATAIKTKVKVGGNGYYRRHLSPNEDGSKIFVREVGENEYINSFNSQANAVEDNQAEEKENYNQNEETEPEIINFILDFESDNRIQLQDIPNDIDYPLQYTKEGLFIIDQSMKLCQITNLLENPQEQEILDVRDTGTYVCKNGDHIFLLEQQSYSKLQLSGIRLQHGMSIKHQVLYKDIPGDWASMIISNDDKTILLQSYTILDDDKYLVTITALEY